MGATPSAPEAGEFRGPAVPEFGNMPFAGFHRSFEARPGEWAQHEWESVLGTVFRWRTASGCIPDLTGLLGPGGSSVVSPRLG